MAKFIAQRLVEPIPVVIPASLLVFAILPLIPRHPHAAMLLPAADSVASCPCALLRIPVFSVFLGRAPAPASGSFARLSLPGVLLGYEGVGLTAPLTRASPLEVMGLDYIRPARAKGLAGRTVVL